MSGSPTTPDPDSLPRSIFVPQTDPRRDLRETVDSVLSDRFMAFLSVILIPIIVLPFFFNFSPDTLNFFDLCDGTVILFFVVEYFAKLYVARNRWDYFRSPWHLLDLVVVVLSFISFLPIFETGSKGSATLLVRLLRLPRAFAVGSRTAGSRIRNQEPQPVVVEKPAPTIIREFDPKMKAEHDDLTWEELEKRLSDKKEEWLDIHNITEEGTLKLSAMLRIPPHHFRPKEVNEVFPHVDYIQDMSFIFLQSGQVRYPKRSDHYMTIARSGQVIVCRGPKIISSSPSGLDLFGAALDDVKNRRGGDHGFVASVLYGILDSALKEYRAIFSEVELEVSKISNTPRPKLPRDFLPRMYELNKEVTRLVSNLIHFKELLGVLTSKSVPLAGLGKTAEDDFKTLQDETSYLGDIADDVVGRIGTLIDLYINQSSFETNRILKILAVITALSIIPTIVGGVLGMNIVDSPFPFSLLQIVIVMTVMMAFIAYCFIKLGWLRT